MISATFVSGVSQVLKKAMVGMRYEERYSSMLSVPEEGMLGMESYSVTVMVCNR